jgi:hypothetical protein
MRVIRMVARFLHYFCVTSPSDILRAIFITCVIVSEFLVAINRSAA